jgi:ATP-dependent Clp protease ATP-binding subunit ClpC
VRSRRRRHPRCGRRVGGGHLPFTPRGKKVLELSLRESLRLKHDHIGPEHILLGLLREGEGLAAQILVGTGLTLDDLRQRTLRALDAAA